MDQPSLSDGSSTPDVRGVTRNPAVAFARGLSRRCPRCGQGHLFRGWFRMVKACPRCALVFEQDEASRLGSAMVNYAFVGFWLVVYLVVGFVLTLPEPPVLPLLLGAVGLIVVTALVFFPFAKTIWAAIDLALHGFEPERKTPLV